MGGGNGAKSQAKRERNAKEAGKGPSSQLKSNAAAQSIQCDVCKQTFQSTTKKPMLQQHLDNKHSGKSFVDAFPKWTD
ncbi:At2g23090 like protein [Papiliotrema laurentii]|uniref:At2g23090 like protein n=1 Tax=Papiliotrema laurentii TaxID=5418 RepID=A0AAD9FRM2_PAPLA|nr:At2g23090 like protein [Papiliotrema laurentii]